jgi:MerR family copper efflux transcriptional regulator
MNHLTIGPLARQAGVSVDAVRFYEREGVLPKAARTPSGYRVYPPDAVARLRFVRRAKALGFSLDEIAGLLTLSRRRDVAAVRRAAESRLSEVERKLDELRRVRAGLRQLIKTCPGHGAPEDCPILNALSGKD